MANNLNQKDNIGLVVGATVPKDLQIIRDHSPGMPILIPELVLKEEILLQACGLVTKMELDLLISQEVSASLVI